MLAPGPTSTTNANSAVAATTIRVRRPAPTRAATMNTSPVTRAQLAPDTAVRWLSELAFIAASSSSETPDSSPIASPGRSAPPSPGVFRAASANADRTGAVHATHAGASATGTALSVADSRKLVDSPGSFARTAPVTSTTAPNGGTPVDPSSAAAANTVSGTASPRTVPPPPGAPPVTASAAPFQLQRSAPSKPEATRRPGLSARTCTVSSRRSSTAVSNTPAVRLDARTADTPHPSATPATTTPMSTASARRRTSRSAATTTTTDTPPAPTATSPALPGDPMPTAQASQTAAAGRARRRSGIRRSPGL